MDKNFLVTKYTQAILSVSLQEDRLDIVGSQLKEFSNILTSFDQLYTILSHPAVQFEYKQKIIEEIGRKLGLELIVINFLKLLSKKKRIRLLGQIVEEFCTQVSTIKGKIKVIAYTAFEFSPLERKKLKEDLEKLFKKEVELCQRQNKELIAGLSLKLDSWIYEFSVRARLEALREKLIKL